MDERDLSHRDGVGLRFLSLSLPAWKPIWGHGHYWNQDRHLLKFSSQLNFKRSAGRNLGVTRHGSTLWRLVLRKYFNTGSRNFVFRLHMRKFIIRTLDSLIKHENDTVNFLFQCT